MPIDSDRSSPSAAPDRFDDLTIADAHRFRARLRKARSARARAAIEQDIDRARGTVERRRASVPQISYPPDLPVTAARERIAEAIRDNRVVIVAGETGSGKTTQLPKICLDLGLGVRGMIGHTQPRRLAARSVSERIAHELDEQVGNRVGYQVRFTDTSSPSTLVKVMTDGILLNEINRDRRLSAYDTIIIDEAHERSLNIDFILGYLARLLQVRDDLKVIVTSATIDPERFVEHFRSVGIEAPIIEVSGRTFPVEIRYRPLTVERGDDLFDRDEVDGVGDAVAELLAEGDGDILVFLSGEREIRDTADAIRDRQFRNLEILPLYGRLSAAEQHRVFQPHTGRRVVLSTNVAETSLTVPGIRYVVDPGTARISRYSLRSKVQRLPIEPISQASARQRSGRCGRVADGICIRLYSEQDFEARPAFTEPEIQRTNLASVVLRMAALRLGRIEDFPFVDPPDPRAVRDGIAVLTELGALDTSPASRDNRPARASADETSSAAPSAASPAAPEGPRLTAVGRELAGIPLDPRMARMLHEAHRTGVLAEVLVIVAALSIQDVRERPTEHRGAADAAHHRFAVPGSDFLAYLRLWDYLRLRRDELSSSAFRRMCRTEYLHYLRVREWQDLHGQLRGIVRDLGWTVDRRELPEASGDDGPPPLAADADRVHRAILAGLLTHIGLREGETREFAGVRGTKFMIFPASSLANKPPRWVMAGELVETSRLWARTAARIEPEWVEQLADHLVKRQYAEPHWSLKREAAMMRERVTLFGVPLVTGRPVQMSRIDPPAARELFIRHALVEGQWRSRHHFLEHNRRLLEDTENLENRARRRDILVDDDALFDFYDRRIDDSVITARQFDSWWKKKRRDEPELLDFTIDVVTNPQASAPDDADFPRIWQQGEVRLDLSYLFEPGNPEDGVTVTIPVQLLDHVRPVGFDWLVPGMRHDLATALIRSLPKDLRRRVVPAPDFADAALLRMPVRSRPFVDALATAVADLTGVPVSPNNFRTNTLDGHLRMNFRIIDDAGRELGRSRDLSTVRAEVRGDRKAPAATPDATPVAADWTADTFGSLADEATRSVRGMTVTTYPGLSADAAGAASVRMYASRAARDLGHRRAVARLAARRIHPAAGSLVGALGTRDRLALSQSPYPSTQALVDDIVLTAVTEQVTGLPDPRTPADFDTLVDRIRPAVLSAAPRILRSVAAILGITSQVRSLVDASATQRFPDTVDDVREQVDSLIFDGFIFDTGSDHLGDLPRYLTGARQRLEALPASADRDRAGMMVLDRVYAQYAQALDALPEGARQSEAARQPAWMIEELRISLFAQSLGTIYPISEKRVARAISGLARR